MLKQKNELLLACTKQTCLCIFRMTRVNINFNFQVVKKHLVGHIMNSPVLKVIHACAFTNKFSSIIQTSVTDSIILHSMGYKIT